MPHSSPAAQPFIVLPVTDSTNNYAMAQVKAGLAVPGTAFLALEQTAGKGQRGKIWLAPPGVNIMMSRVIDPAPLALSEQFALSAAVALGCYDFFKKYAGAEDCRIKWPNDLYWQDRKAGGILIENLLSASGDWKTAIAGTGININQAAFPDSVQGAVSLLQITGKQHDLMVLALELYTAISYWLERLKTEGPIVVLEAYNRVLYRNGETIKLRKEGMVFETRILGVNLQGQLLTADPVPQCWDHGMVEWVRGA